MSGKYAWLTSIVFIRYNILGTDCEHILHIYVVAKDIQF